MSGEAVPSRNWIPTVDSRPCEVQSNSANATLRLSRPF